MPAFDGVLPPGMAGVPAVANGMPPSQALQIPRAPLPPSLRAGVPGAGAGSVPQGNPGNALAALSMVQTAVGLLQKALPAIPMGTPAHNDVLKSVSTLSKHVADAHDSQSQIQQLMAAIQQTAAAKPQEALARLAATSPAVPPALPPSAAPAAGVPPMAGAA